jgi:hypothetical protein
MRASLHQFGTTPPSRSSWTPRREDEPAAVNSRVPCRLDMGDRWCSLGVLVVVVRALGSHTKKGRANRQCWMAADIVGRLHRWSGLGNPSRKKYMARGWWSRESMGVQMTGLWGITSAAMPLCAVARSPRRLQSMVRLPLWFTCGSSTFQSFPGRESELGGR